MKRLIAVISMLITIMPLVNGQNRDEGTMPTSEERSKKIAGKLAQKLVLNKSEKDSVQVIFSDFFDNLKIYHSAGDEKIVMALEKTRDDKMKILLKTSLKFEEYTSYMQDLKAKHEKSLGVGGGKNWEGSGHHHNEGTEGDERNGF
ncbi:MAG: hypothetical protein WCM76_05395 [Bacteroidota bacterium]